MTQLNHYDWASVPLDFTWYDLFWAVPFRGAGTMFKLGVVAGSQRWIWVKLGRGVYPRGALLVLNKEVVNKLLLFSTGREPTRSHP